MNDSSNMAPQLAQLRALSLAADQVALTWLGQSSFALRAADRLLLIDPFLSPYPGRQVPPPFSGQQATGVDLVLCTHEHVDHFDADTVRDIAAASPHARIIVPTPIVSMVTALGIAPNRVLGAQPGTPLGLYGMTIHPVPAMHGVEIADAYSFGQELSNGLYRFLGYVIKAGRVRAYLAGDTIAYDGMEDWLRPLEVDIALLPINGRDPKREAENLVGNLNHTEAVQLAAAIGSDALIPMHYDMFARNPGYPDKAVAEAVRKHPELTVVVPARDRPWIYTKP